MASDLKLNLALTGSGTLTGAGGLGPATEAFTVGQGSFASKALAFTFGTGNFQATRWYAARRTGLGAGLNDDLDLNGGLTNGIGESVVLTSLKLLLVAVVAPDGVKKLRVGPNGLGTGFQGPFSGVAAGAYIVVDSWCPVIYNPWGGYPLVAGVSDGVRVNNPGAAAVDYEVLAVGV